MTRGARLLYVRDVPAAAERIEVTGAGVTLSGFATAGSATDTPLLLLLHGGAVDARYFDPVAETAAANGFSAVALNRPGYVGVEPAGFARQASVVDAAVSRVWRERGGGRPGVVVFGHSIGAAVTIHLAARTPAEWPLLGISLTGISTAAPPFMAETWEALAEGERIAFSPEATGTVQLAAPASSDEAATPVAELLEIVRRWPAECPALCARVAVPVQYAVGERDKLWVVREATPGEFAALFSSAPYVDAQLLPRVGHTVEHDGLLGRSHALRQLSFALRCTGPAQPGARSRGSGG